MCGIAGYLNLDPQQPVDPTQRVLASAPGPKAIAVRREVPLKDRFENVAQGALGHSVAHGGNTQRALFRTARLGNVFAFDSFRLPRVVS